MDAVIAEILKSGLMGAILIALAWYCWQLKKEIKEKDNIIIDLLKEYSKERLAEQQTTLTTVQNINNTIANLNENIKELRHEVKQRDREV